jgi:hypothetical protein
LVYNLKALKIKNKMNKLTLGLTLILIGLILDITCILLSSSINADVIVIINKLSKYCWCAGIIVYLLPLIELYKTAVKQNDENVRKTENTDIID